MTEDQEWEFPAAAQPSAEDVGFALDDLRRGRLRGAAVLVP